MLGLALAGCGDDDEDGEATATTAAATGGGATLNGSVGPGFDISVSDTDGLAAGDYTLVVDDQSSAQLPPHRPRGGGRLHRRLRRGRAVADLALVAGEYRFQCDPHASSMNGTFTVG